MDGVEEYIKFMDLDVKSKICEFLASKGISDYNIDVTSATKEGGNHTGIIAKLNINGKDSEENTFKFDWILKNALREDIYRNMMKLDQMYKREVLIYEKILPQFKQFESEKEIASPILEIPRYVLSYLEPSKESIVVQDMKSLGYRKGPLNLRNARWAMKAYGKLHAISYAMKDQNPEEFEQIRKDTENAYFEGTGSEEIAEFLDAHHDKVIGCLSPVKDPKVLDMYKKYAEQSFHILMDTMLLAEKDPSAVVVHGDCGINNMLFKYDDTSNPNYPTRICLLDWQQARYGSLAFDLSCFFYTSTDKQFREKHYDKLIRFYYYSLCGYLTELGSNPELLVSLEMVQEQLKRYSICGFHMSTMVLHTIWNKEEEISGGKDESSEEVLSPYQERMREIVVDFYERGYFDFLL